ncbi:uncharacterized protein PV09_07190 [Verruconis gallopava]|uniref:Nucleotide-diphospho-sugar transferase domain-containing protein n=1 Tax=Verruconis gallopava TaxID=253628 RepID=A0A0D2A4N8_9PEZI|nr:uncharacterized protein PV09_07190 [Verruconis gallopava]KIW01430.1 hypothetical protein PV09_07190 [Verruconis gallopava]
MSRLFRSTRFVRSFLLGVLSTVVLWTYLSSHTILRLVFSHSYDLNFPAIYRAQFQVYILTHDCGRFTSDIASAFDPESVILVPDVADSPACAALGLQQVFVERVEGNSTDDTYRFKYAYTLWHCRNGDKMKCLFLEDDVVMLHDRQRTQEVLVENTLTLFNHEENAYDCTKRGFGWIRSKTTGNGSQCRIYSKPSTECMTYCLTQYEHKQLDYGLAACQNWCGLSQRRFLLAVHGGLSSTMERNRSLVAQSNQHHRPG